MRAVNLLPREPKRRRKPSVVVQLAILAPFVVAGLLTAGYLLASTQVGNRKSELAALRDELAALPQPPPQPQTNPMLAVQREQRVAALSTALQRRLAWDRILRQVSAVLPDDVWLTALSATGPAPTSAAPAATTTTSPDSTAAAPATAGPLSITGYTYSPEGVARLLSRLAVVPSLQGVQLAQSARTLIAGRTVFSFSIQAGVRAGETG